VSPSSRHQKKGDKKVEILNPVLPIKTRSNRTGESQKRKDLKKGIGNPTLSGYSAQTAGVRGVLRRKISLDSLIGEFTNYEKEKVKRQTVYQRRRKGSENLIQ